jgi:hypothetical protein
MPPSNTMNNFILDNDNVEDLKWLGLPGSILYLLCTDVWQFIQDLLLCEMRSTQGLLVFLVLFVYTRVLAVTQQGCIPGFLPIFWRQIYTPA